MKSFYYTGASMLPTFSEGDMLLATEYEKFEDIEIGDIVIFKPLNSASSSVKFIVHRVKEILENERVVTKGDNNIYPDQRTVPFEDILGKVTNGATPDRVQKYFLHNQHSKKSRQLAREIIQKNESEKQALEVALEQAKETATNSPEYQAYINLPKYEEFLQALADYDDLEKPEIIDENTEVPEEVKLAEEAIMAIRKELEDTIEYQSYFTSSLYQNLIEAQKALQIHEGTKVITDSKKTREQFIVSSFPTAVLDIPEYFKETGEIVNAKKEYLKMKKSENANINSLANFEAQRISDIKLIIGREKFSEEDLVLSK